MVLPKVCFLSGVLLTSVSGDCPSDWYYKSGQSCTGSDSPSTMKCKPNAKSWTCSRQGEAHCGEHDKVQCKDVGQPFSTSAPDGIGFMCPSLMLGTSELVAAAKKDGYHGAYGVVTIDSLSCGQCVEITNEDPTHFPRAPKILAQVFNSVANSVDIFMAGGGLGANNGCAAIPGQFHKPLHSMYKKYPSSSNTELVELLKKHGYGQAHSQIDAAIMFNGGLRGGRTYAECLKKHKYPGECQPPNNGCDGGGGLCIHDPVAICPVAYQGHGDYVTQKAQESCHFAFEHDLHWNRPVSYRTVSCPARLTKLTGLVPRTTDAAGEAHETRGPLTANASSVRTTSTTMEDCCEPTCSRSSQVKGSWKQGFEAMYTCNLNGERYLEGNNPISNPCDRRRRAGGRRRCAAVRRRRTVLV